MKANYHIDKNLKTVFLTVEDETSLSDLIRHVKKMYEDPEFETNFNNFTDLSDARPSITVNIETIKDSVDFVKSSEHVIGKCKWAVFCPEDYTYTIALIFRKLFESEHIKMKIFKNKEEAMAWLNLNKRD